MLAPNAGLRLAVGGVIGSLPAGWIGLRFGRRRAMLIGFGLMGACLLALDGGRQRPAGPAPCARLGDPLNGGLFDLFGGYRPLLMMMAG